MEISLIQMLPNLTQVGQGIHPPGKGLGKAQPAAFAGLLELLQQAQSGAAEDVLQAFMPTMSIVPDEAPQFGQSELIVLPDSLAEGLLSLSEDAKPGLAELTEDAVPGPGLTDETEDQVTELHINPLTVVVTDLPVVVESAGAAQDELEGAKLNVVPETAQLAEDQSKTDSPERKAQGKLPDMQPGENARSDVAKERQGPPVFAAAEIAGANRKSAQKHQDNLSVNQGASGKEMVMFPARTAVETPAAQFGKLQVARAGVMEQVLEKMVLSRQADGESTLTVRLKPAALGDVEIKLRMEDGMLTARIVAESQHVKEALDTAMGQLRQRLEAQQIQVGDVTVTVAQEQDFRQGRGREDNPRGTEREGTGYVHDGVMEEVQSAGMLPGLLDIRA
jgi:flagellar hook-length control protein FliK